MPHSTCRFPFEWKIREWVAGLSRTLAGDAHYPLLILLTAEGVVQRIVLGPSPQTHDDGEWEALRRTASAWLSYDPFEGPEYQYVSWEGITQSTIERLLGSALGPADLTAQPAAPETIPFPEKWGVMF